METEDIVALFIRLITTYAAAHHRHKPTLEALQEMARNQGYSFSAKEVKKYGDQALEKMYFGERPPIYLPL